jgi:hypothetical protein
MKPRFAICVDNSQWLPGVLELQKSIVFAGCARPSGSGDIRVIDESGEDYLFLAYILPPLNCPDEMSAFLWIRSQSAPQAL